MRFPAVFAAFSLIAACSNAPAPVSLSGTAALNMLSQTLPVYAAKLRLARQIAASCERYDFDEATLVALSAARPDTARGRLQAIRNAPGIEVATDVEIRSFQARHGVEIGASDLCTAGDAEVAAQSGISALLIAR